MKRGVLTLLSAGVLVLGMSAAASAQGRGNGNNGNNGNGNGTRVAGPRLAAIPEIDPSSAIQAMALLSGGLLVIRGRRRTSTT